MRNHIGNSMEIKAEVMKALLHNVAITAEFTARFGLSQQEVQGLITQAMEHIERVFQDKPEPAVPPPSSIAKVHLEAEELSLLLEGFDET